MNKNDCCIIRDLLPAYMEDLVSEETKLYIGEHLAQCEECRNEYVRMNGEITVHLDKPPKKDKKLLLYLNSARIWYLICPLIAVMLALTGLLNALYTYSGIMLVLGGVFFASQFMSSASWGFDYDQYYLSQDAKKHAEKKWGLYRLSPLSWAIPPLAVSFLVLLYRFLQG